jgi:hypothetical protein
MSGTVHGSTRDPEGGIGTSAVLVGLAFLIVAAACALTAFKIYVSVKGGRIAFAWMWMLAGFCLLGFSQLVLFATQSGFLALTTDWIELMRVFSLVLVLFGAIRLRRLHA